MDLTVTDASWRDVGIVTPTDGDFAWGQDENDFSVDMMGQVPEEGALMYADGSEIGGIVRGYSTQTDIGTFSVVGDTWTGVLDSHVLGPDNGQAYYTVSGDVRDCASTLIGRLGLGGLFVVASGRTGVVVSHTFQGSQDASQQDAGRYMGGWQAMWQLLYEHGCKARFAWDDVAKRVVMTVDRRHDWTDAESQSAGLAVVGVSRRAPTNHLICMGKGDLADREILHLYADARGNVSTTQTLTGLHEIAETYDDSSKEGDELRSDGAKKLRDLWADSQTVDITAANGVSFDLGDVIGGTDARSGIGATAVVSKKVASFKQGRVSWSFSSTVRG